MVGARAAGVPNAEHLAGMHKYFLNGLTNIYGVKEKGGRQRTGSGRLFKDPLGVNLGGLTNVT